MDKEDAFLKDKQALLDDIKKRHHCRPNKNTVIGAVTSYYEIHDYRESKPYQTGKVERVEGVEEEACFLTFKQSEEALAATIFRETSKIADNEGILKPFFRTYYEPKKVWLIAYRKFDSFLSDDPSNIVLPENRGDSIRKLLETIKHIHKRRIFHGGLKERCSYVISEGRIKIVFGSSLSTRADLRKKGRMGYYEDLEEVESRKMKDLKDFRDLLKDVMLHFGVDWEDKDSFLQFFDRSTQTWFGYDGFIDHLIDHPALKDASERNEYLFLLEHYIITNTLHNAGLFMQKLKGEEFMMYSNWDANLGQAPALEKVYNKKGVSYKVDQVRDLIRFLSNAHVHYDSKNKEKDLDRDVRTLYPDFLNRLHCYLCRLPTI